MSWAPRLLTQDRDAGTAMRTAVAEGQTATPVRRAAPHIGGYEGSSPQEITSSGKLIEDQRTRGGGDRNRTRVQGFAGLMT